VNVATASLNIPEMHQSYHLHFSIDAEKQRHAAEKKQALYVPQHHSLYVARTFIVSNAVLIGRQPPLG
jgi:hypothetical protein